MDFSTGKDHLPARTPEEIAARLYAMASKLDKRLDAGEPISAEAIRAVAQRLRSYAIRLRGAAAPYA